MSRPVTVFLLHALGGAAASWTDVIDRLDGVECIAIDLPGFGEAADDPRVTVEETVRRVETVIAARDPARWIIVGHSMGGKIATIVAARAEQGIVRSGLVGVVLLAASPPSPEPIDHARRQDMIDWVADGPIDEAQAARFVDDNTAGELSPAARDEAIAIVRRSAANAWHAWLTRGSREDWSRTVGQLSVPATIVAGGEDGDLGEATQRALNLPHYRYACVEVAAGAAHLLPLEAPERVAALIQERIAHAAPDSVPTAFADLIASDRVSARTRSILLDRATPDDPDYRPAHLTTDQLRTLRLLVALIVPDAGIDLAARIDAGLGQGDGWRFATLPDDITACRLGLDALSGLGFEAMTETDREALLRTIAAGDAADGALDGAQMRAWFEDVRADAVRIWISHPATMARIGYDGVANGGDGMRKQGFQRTAADTREAWEPRA